MDIATNQLKRKISSSSEAVSQATQRLARDDLARSGLTLDDAHAAGIFAANDASATNPDFAPKPALVLPYFDANGAPLTYERDGVAIPFCRARYLVPRGFPLPKKRRYDQPGDSGTPPYFPPGFDWTKVAHGDLDAVVITEGEKKALALTRAGIPAIAIGGVFNFGDGAATLHPAIAAIAGKLRDVYIIFDSDAATKPDIKTAEWRLAGYLALAGCNTHVVRIPPDGELKIGADDFLVAHGADALRELIISTPPLGARSVETSDYVISVAEMLGRETYPIEELIPGLVEKGVPVFIAGAGGSFKSRLAMQWGLCLNAGVAVWGRGASLDGLRAPQATLVYCSAEDDANELARRAQAISRAIKLPKAKQGVFLSLVGRNTALAVMGESAEVDVRPFYHELFALLRSIPGHKIVVLDSAYDFVRFAGKAKIDEDSVNFYIKVLLQGICTQTDSTILIPWHPSRAGSERSEMGGWSVAWENAPRSRLTLRKDKDIPGTAKLRVEKRNHGPDGEEIMIRLHDGVLLPVDAVPDDGKAAALRQACVSAALKAAEMKPTFTIQRRIPSWALKEIEAAVGKTVSSKLVCEELQAAVAAGDLTYLHGTNMLIAGFYPADEARAHALARRGGGADRVRIALKTGLKTE